ncbi:MAG: efflux RND transporter permease subunit [Vicinamibacterales bacterium]
MNPSALFIRRPVTTTLIMLGIAVFGVMSYRVLPVSDLPVVDFPTIQVSASLPGASPETMASSVALPLEKAFATISGLSTMNSSSGMGGSSITLQFDLNRNIDSAAQDVQSMISKTARALPPQMPAPPSYQKVNPGDQPVMQLVLRAETILLSTVTEYAESTIAQRLSMVSGVAQVQILGGPRYAVRVDADPRRLAASGIGFDEVADAISTSNANLPTGTIYGPEKTFTVLANGRLMNAKAYSSMIVAYRNGNPVHLNEIAHVYDGIDNDRVSGWYGDVSQGPRPMERAMYLQIMKQPGTNVVAVADAVKALLPALREQLPASVSLEIRSDRSESIRESVADVKFTLVLTIALVVMVIFLFLRNISATVIPSLALPGSILATFAVMYLLNYSLDNLSLMALTLSVGFVVDDAIVMLENIVRHMEMGKPPMQAALDGAQEVSFTILSMTLSLAVVFVPVLFMGGVIGRLLNEFAVTIAVAILVSGFVSISLTPMLCSRFLQPPHATRHGFVYGLFEKMFDGWLKFYGVTLRAAMRFHPATFGVSLLLLYGTWHLYTITPVGFLPSEDQGRFSVITEAIQGIGYDEMLRHSHQVADVLSHQEGVRTIGSVVGAGGPNGSMNNGRFIVNLAPRHERTLHVDQIIAALRPKLAQVPGMRVFMVNTPPIALGGQFSRSLYQITLQDSDTDELYRSAPIFERTMREMPGLEDVTSDLQLSNPQVRVEMDRDRVGALGLNATQVETALFNAYGSRQVSQIFAPNNQYNVLLQVAPEFQRDPAALGLLYVRSKTGGLVPLNTVARVRTDSGPQTVSHAGQLPSVTIGFNLKAGYALGDAIPELKAAAAQSLPSGVTTVFQGTAQAFQETLQGLGIILILSVVVIYIVLGVLYESFTHPLTILSGLPAAGFGALLTLLVFKTELSLYAMVGVIMLIGLVKKNGIMMVDFAVSAQAAGKSPRDAIYEACMVRFRPIMMTTMAALVGTLPIALGYGAGAEARRPLGLAVVGGLLVSQLLTLYITPVYYVYIETLRSLLTRGRKTPALVLAGHGPFEPVSSGK